MEPTVPSGSVVLASPLIYGAEAPFTDFKLPAFRKPRRGDVVICTPEYQPDSSWLEGIINKTAGFFTLQKKELRPSEDNWLYSKNMKRVLGIPGDTIMIRDFEVMIKPAGKNFFFSEHDIIQVEYETTAFPPPRDIPENFPFAGNLDEIRLGDGEYFVAGDNRSVSNDSSYWGALSQKNINARVLLELRPEMKLVR